VVDSIEMPDNELTTLARKLHHDTQIHCTQIVPNSWYNDTRFYLLHITTPRNIDPRNRRALRLRFASFQLINDVLFRKNFDGVFMRCLEKEESEKVLAKLHSGDAGGHLVETQLPTKYLGLVTIGLHYLNMVMLWLTNV